MSTAEMMEAAVESVTTEFDVSGLFDDDTSPAEADAENEAIDPDADTEIHTPDADDLDDGPQPGDELDDAPAETDESVADDSSEVEQAAIAPTAAPAPPLSLDEYEQERRDAADRVAEAALAQAEAVAATKAAKKRFESALEDLQDIIDRGPEDRPLFDKPAAPPPAVTESAVAASDDDDAEGSTDDESTASESEAAVPIKIAEGQIRIRLLKKIIDDHPTRGKLEWEKGVELTAHVDSSGTTVIPFIDDPSDGTALEAEEFAIIGEAVIESGDADAVVDDSDDPRLDTPLAETPIPKNLVQKLAESEIVTVRDLAAYTREAPLTDIKGIGQAKAEKIEAAMVEFWARAR